jgi:hypothetical protein
MSQRATRFVNPGVEPALPHSPFGGTLIRDLERTVEAAEDGNGKLRILPQSDPPPKLKHRDFIRLIEMVDHSMHCSSTDCPRLARLLLECRDQEVLPYCTACALVEFAQWMAGV